MFSIGVLSSYYRSQKCKNYFKKKLFITFFSFLMWISMQSVSFGGSEGEAWRHYRISLILWRFCLDFAMVLPWFFKRTPFAFQKGSFCIPKGLLLLGKRTRFAMQKDPFWKSVGFQVKSEKRKMKNPLDFVGGYGVNCCIIPFCRMPQKSTPNPICYRKMKKNSRKSFVFAKNFLPLHPQSSRQDCSNIMLQ